MCGASRACYRLVRTELPHIHAGDIISAEVTAASHRGRDWPDLSNTVLKGRRPAWRQCCPRQRSSARQGCARSARRLLRACRTEQPVSGSGNAAPCGARTCASKDGATSGREDGGLQQHAQARGNDQAASDLLHAGASTLQPASCSISRPPTCSNQCAGGIGAEACKAVRHVHDSSLLHDGAVATSADGSDDGLSFATFPPLEMTPLRSSLRGRAAHTGRSGELFLALPTQHGSDARTNVGQKDHTTTKAAAVKLQLPAADDADAQAMTPETSGSQSASAA